MATMNAIGRELFLFQDDSGQAGDNLLITSHGEYVPRPEFGQQTNFARNIPGMGGWISVPADVTLHLYGPHKSALRDPGLLSVMTNRIAHLETMRSPQKIRNYRLSKYQCDETSETYDTIKRDIDYSRELIELRRYAVLSGNESLLHKLNFISPIPFRKFDILTIRNRWWRYSVTLHDVFELLARSGRQYANIHCSFCRSRTVGPSPTYSARPVC